MVKTQPVNVFLASNDTSLRILLTRKKVRRKLREINSKGEGKKWKGCVAFAAKTRETAAEFARAWKEKCNETGGEGEARRYSEAKAETAGREIAKTICAPEALQKDALREVAPGAERKGKVSGRNQEKGREKKLQATANALLREALQTPKGPCKRVEVAGKRKKTQKKKFYLEK